jgi:hypothetical protein
LYSDNSEKLDSRIYYRQYWIIRRPKHSEDRYTWIFYGFFHSSTAFKHSERVNRLILYGASCGGREGIPQTPEVAKTISDFVKRSLVKESESSSWKKKTEAYTLSLILASGSLRKDLREKISDKCTFSKKH